MNRGPGIPAPPPVLGPSIFELLRNAVFGDPEAPRKLKRNEAHGPVQMVGASNPQPRRVCSKCGQYSWPSDQKCHECKRIFVD
jgi:hypothetical protein